MFKSSRATAHFPGAPGSYPISRHIENGHFPDRLAMLCSQRERGGCAPVVSDYEDFLLAKYLMNQAPNVLRAGFFRSRPLDAKNRLSRLSRGQ